MLIVDGALAVWNGLLVATAKVWCECVRGGTCCGGECRCDEGVCCDGVWHPNNDPHAPCGEGEIFLQWGENNVCCDCVPEVIFDGRVQANVNTADVVGDLCCPLCPNGVLLPFSEVDGAFAGCVGRCCGEQGCVNTREVDCAGQWLSGCCEGRGCPKSCCGETSDGVAVCDTVDELACAGTVDPEPCETACKGACCIDGELAENSPMTQADCDSIDGCWGGVGSSECLEDGSCRAPFDENCCESVTSSAARLTFRGPRKKRCPELDRCGNQVTVSVTTGSPVYVHGNLFGSPYETCTDVVTFFLCNDEFHVTPAPCSGKLQNLNIEVCWEEAESESELLRFQCCQNITYLLGNDDCDCVTTLLYEGGGCTSNATLQMRGDAIIDASGAGALVLTTQVNGGNEEKTLTLAGTSTAANTINRISGQGVSVVKDGTGLWRMNAPSKAFWGTITVKNGTMHVANAGAMDSAVTVGGTEAGGIAALLLEKDIIASFDVIVPPGSQTVFIGGANTTGSAILSSGVIQMGRDVTLVAKTGGSVNFSNTWSGATYPSTSSYNVNIGAPGYAGEVQLFNAGTLETTGAVAVRYGTAALGYSTLLVSSALTLGSEGGPVTIDLGGGTSRHGSLLFVGNGNTVINTEISQGSLRLDNSGSTATVTAGGTGNEIASTVTLDDQTAFAISGGLEISGDILGDSGITKSGAGALTLSGALSYSGTTDIVAGSVVTQTLVSGPAKFASATFTPTGLTVAFSSTPASGEEYRLLPGATTQTYGTVTLTGAGSATATYDSSTSTLTID